MKGKPRKTIRKTHYISANPTTDVVGSTKKSKRLPILKKNASEINGDSRIK